MGLTAQFAQFGPFFSSSGVLYGAPKLYHYAPGTTSLKDAYTGRDKSVTAAQPIVGTADGLVSGFFDGLYKIVVKSNDDLTTIATWDNFDFTESIHRLEGTLTWDPTALLPGQSQLSSSITVTGCVLGDYVVVAAPYDLQGIRATAYVSSANTVRILLDRPAGMLTGSTTWDPASLVIGAAATSPGITVTGAALGDAVAVYPPYDLQGIQAMGYVSAANTVVVVLERPVSMLTGSLVWDPASLADGAGATSPTITVTGAALGDTVLVYPPYDLQDTTVTGYVQAADSVEIHLQNESGGVRDLASGTWVVRVIPQGTAIDLASGTWQVGVIPKGTAIDLANGTWSVRVIQN